MPRSVLKQSTYIPRVVAYMTGAIATLAFWCARIEGQSAVDTEAVSRELPNQSPTTAASDHEKSMDRSALVQSYNQARDAYKRQDWEIAGEKYEEVSRQCPGTPLALECNYHALLTHWQRESPNSPSLTRAWLQEAARLQRKSNMNRSDGSNNPVFTPHDSWIAQAHWLLTQWEQNRGKLVEAEERLRALLEVEGTTRDPSVAWPMHWKPTQKHWNSLGNMLVASNRDLDVARFCFEQSSALSNGTRGQQHEALLG
ncbi:MAG: hypothetical protein FJ308_11165, partial [Planctomycetes bacterium]|nr:hypothetical protein [Planctomycetota bacterium]